MTNQEADQFPFFKDRTDAGQRLAKELNYLQGERLAILSILPGGVPVGLEICRHFNCCLDLACVHKLHLPGHPEIGFGAIGLDGMVNIDYEITRKLGLTQRKTEEITQQTFDALRERTEILATNRPPQSLFFKTAIIVDDGLDSGYTMLTAIRAARKKSPKRILVAVPTAAHRGLERIKTEIKDIIALYTHPPFSPFSIEASYQKWQSISNQEVKESLIKFWKDN
ncbi:MAG: phosphoribosyltransferase [Candidatus Pacebacteria bacterium]|nr:phosphoribosyltransferase [Candidatus Paceibacterota bacterium]